MNAKAIPVLGIPHYNRPDLLARCIASIDYPVEKLVVVVNGAPQDMIALVEGAIVGRDPNYRTGADAQPRMIKLCDWPADRRNMIRSISYVSHPNAGVAGAWNEIIKLFPAPWWLISNNDIEFAMGDLAKMAAAVTGVGAPPAPSGGAPDGTREARVLPGMFYGNHGASWFAITAEAVGKAGLFDENLYPAYLEVCDMSRRFDLLGLGRGDVPDVHAIHGDAARGISGSTTVHSDPSLSAKNARTHGGNFDYYRCKWGGINEQEVFLTPFNDPHWPIWAWKFDPAHRAEQQW